MNLAAAVAVAVAICPDWYKDGPDGTRLSWVASQMEARMHCAACTHARDWGEGEEGRAWAAREAHDGNFRPLEEFSFFALRGVGAAPVVVRLRDGRRMVSFQPQSGSVGAPARCAQLLRMLSGQDSTRLVVVRGRFTPREVESIEAEGLGTWRASP